MQFPGIDRESLAQSESEVESRRAELQRALEAVASARERLETAQGALFDQVRRAHAYATVFAEQDVELLDALRKIELEPSSLAPRKTRGRPPKRNAKRQTSLTVADDAA